MQASQRETIDSAAVFVPGNLLQFQRTPSFSSLSSNCSTIAPNYKNELILLRTYDHFLKDGAYGSFCHASAVKRNCFLIRMWRQAGVNIQLPIEEILRDANTIPKHSEAEKGKRKGVSHYFEYLWKVCLGDSYNVKYETKEGCQMRKTNVPWQLWVGIGTFLWM